MRNNHGDTEARRGKRRGRKGAGAKRDKGKGGKTAGKGT